MERDDIRAFVAHWHDAARQECPPDASVLDTYERSLIQTSRDGGTWAGWDSFAPGRMVRD
ncbi:hypothetical protein ACWC0A_05430 [Streptomyces scopuliridis]